MMNKKEYEQLCLKFNEAKMYDGRDTIDLYVCKKCGSYLTSTYVDKGVTPFMLKCKCGHFMTHTRTVDGTSAYNIDIKWVRPTYEQFLCLSEATQEHIKNGGLIMKSELEELKIETFNTESDVDKLMKQKAEEKRKRKALKRLKQ